VWCLRSSLHNSIVIPGNPGSQSGVARPGIHPFFVSPFSKKGGDTVGVLDARFREHDGRETPTSFCELSSTTLGQRQTTVVFALAISSSLYR
jgi:hypothetical protein